MCHTAVTCYTAVTCHHTDCCHRDVQLVVDHADDGPGVQAPDPEGGVLAAGDHQPRPRQLHPRHLGIYAVSLSRGGYCPAHPLLVSGQHAPLLAPCAPHPHRLVRAARGHHLVQGRHAGHGGGVAWRVIVSVDSVDTVDSIGIISN